MARWYYPSVFDELAELKKYRESLLRQMSDPSPMALLPAPAVTAAGTLPAHRAGRSVEITDTGSEIMVTAALIPGISRHDISLTLISPYIMEISCARREEFGEETGGYVLQGRGFGWMTRTVPLPGPVSEEGARASCRDGVLEVHLKKSKNEPKGTIPVS